MLILASFKAIRRFGFLRVGVSTRIGTHLPAEGNRRIHPSFGGTALVLLLLVLASAGCENNDAVLGGAIIGPGKLDVTFSGDIQPILITSCALSGCHSNSSQEALLDLSPEGVFDPEVGAVGVASLVAPHLLRISPGNADQSYLVAKVEGRQEEAGGYGETMPLGAAPLSPEAISLLRRWIDDGALAN